MRFGKNMKSNLKNLTVFVTTSLFWILLMNCAGMSKSSPRSYRHQAWRACAKPDADRLGVSLHSLLGKLCYTRCKKDLKECDVKKLETLVTDLTQEVDYAKFRDSQFFCRTE